MLEIRELGSRRIELIRKLQAEKEKAQVQHEAEDLAAQLDAETSAKLNNEKLAKQFELQLSEIQTKCDEQSRQLQDFTSLKVPMRYCQINN